MNHKTSNQIFLQQNQGCTETKKLSKAMGLHTMMERCPRNRSEHTNQGVNHEADGKVGINTPEAQTYQGDSVH
ncbi:hypothetical protein L9G16_22405, partial [Shewanella sp. A25]|nr:hypothetical protein [Shewanella shenzhenensis]